MRGRRALAVAAGLVLVVAGVSTTALIALAGSPPNVTTGDYDNLRTNWDPNEAALGPSTVQSSSFGKVFSTTVKGEVYAQPLVVNGTVIVTTEKAFAYGINATTGAVEWKRHFGTAVTSATINCTDLTPDVGSTSTPVEDPSTGVVYLTARLETGKGGPKNAAWFLEAVSAATGQEQTGYPVKLTGTPANTPGVPFDAYNAMQRPALLLLNGVVYMAFASNCDHTPYRGIVMGVSTSTRAITTMWSDESGIGTDRNSQAGIWQSGSGLVSDEPGRIILTTGNGVSPQPAAAHSPPATLSESVVALTVGTDGTLTPTDFFAPSNASNLDANDEDLGSGGPVALPTTYFGTSAHPHLLVQVGKDGRVFLIDADDMGGNDQGSGGTDDVLQTIGPYDGVWGHPAVYGGQGGWVYVLESAGGGYLRAYRYGVNGSGLPQLSSAGTSTGTFGYTSGSPLVTSNGTTSGSAVVWVVYSSGGQGLDAQLQAYGAVPSGGTLPLLWSAPIGTASKFTVPTAYNGRIYVGTRDGKLIAFGSTSNAPVQAAPLDFGSVPVGHSRTLTLDAATTANLTLDGPVTASGYQGGASAPAPSTSTSTTTSTSAGPTGSGTSTPSTTVPGGTAGPSSIPPSGTAPLAPGSVFGVEQPAVGSTFRSGSTLRLRVTFRPTRPGPVVAQLSIPTSAGVRTVAVSGYGTGPGLLLSAQPLQFGTVPTGAGGRYLTLTFSNSWNHRETITGIDRPDGPFTVSGLPPVGTVLAPGQTVTVSVRFDPVDAGSFASSLRVVTDHGAATAPMSGSAQTGYSHLSTSATTVDAGSVPVGGSATVTFDVGNDGTVALRITRAIAPGGAFSTAAPLPEGLVIDPGTFLHQTVTFRPTAPGPVSAQYLFRADNGQGPVVVTITGTGT